jgi:hypothetical protein
MKRCSICDILKPLDEFYSQKKYSKKRGEWIYYNPECKECTIKRSSKYNKEHPEVLKTADLKRNKSEERQQYLIDLSRERRENGKYLEWQRNSPERHKGYRTKRKHKEHDISDEEWLKCKEYFNFECAYCGLKLEEHFIKRLGKIIKSDFHKEHVDHDGSNKLDNCVPSCMSCNSSKRQKELEKWYIPKNKRFNTGRLDKIHKWLDEDYKLYINK